MTGTRGVTGDCVCTNSALGTPKIRDISFPVFCRSERDAIRNIDLPRSKSTTSTAPDYLHLALIFHC